MRTSIRGVLAATLLAGCGLAATPALAQDAAPAESEAPKSLTITGNVSLVTDYRFRGVSLSGGDPAIQGGITATHKSGFYVGTWASSIRGGSLYGEQELDVFGGWTGEVTSGLTLDGGLLWYVYPGGKGGKLGKANYLEPYASLTGVVGPAKVKVGVAYAFEQKSLPDILGNKDDNLYLYGNVDVAVPSTPVTVSGHIGYADGIQAPGYYVSGDKTGLDWSIGATATVYGPLSVGVAYIGVTGPSIDSFTNDAVVGTLTATF